MDRVEALILALQLMGSQLVDAQRKIGFMQDRIKHLEEQSKVVTPEA